MSNRQDIDENRRRIWKLGGYTLLGGLVLGAEQAREYLSQGDTSGTPAGGGSPEPASEPQGYSPGELYDWDSVGKCLSTEQEESVTEVVDRYESLSKEEDLRYSIETDGNVIVHAPDEDGYKPIAETTDNDFMCEIDY